MQSPSQFHLLNLRDLRQRNTLNAPEMLKDQNLFWRLIRKEVYFQESRRTGAERQPSGLDSRSITTRGNFQTTRLRALHSKKSPQNTTLASYSCAVCRSRQRAREVGNETSHFAFVCHALQGFSRLRRFQDRFRPRAQRLRGTRSLDSASFRCAQES